MQFKETVLSTLLFLFPVFVFAQTTFIPQGAKENILIERMEIKAGTDSVLNFSKTKPYSREQFIPRLLQLDTANLSRTDKFNLYTTILNNLEWVDAEPESYPSKHPLLKHFFTTPATLFEVHQPDFFLAINPIFQYVVGKEQNNDEHIF
jgi:hypothetical protein